MFTYNNIMRALKEGGIPDYWYAQFDVNDANVQAIGLADRDVTVTSAGDVGYQYKKKPSTLLKAFYNCNTVNGLVLVDELGTNNGTLYGGATTVSVIGTAISFNGTTSDGATTNALSNLSSFALSIWVNVTWRNSVYDCIFMQESSSTQDGRFRVFNYGQNDGLVMQFGGVLLNSGGIRPVGQTHIVCQYNHLTGLVQMYLNGVLIDSSTISTGLVTLSDNLLIGKVPNFYSVNPDISINGSVDKIRIFNRTLDTQEIEALALELRVQDNIKVWHDKIAGDIYSKLTRYNYDDASQTAGTATHWYELNTDSNDSVGTAHGTDTDITYSGGGAVFNGTTSKITLPSSIYTAQWRTLEIVFELNDVLNSILFNIRNAASSTLLDMRIFDNGDISYRVFTNALYTASAATKIVANKKYYAVLTYNSTTGEILGYLDGELVAQATTAVAGNHGTGTAAAIGYFIDYNDAFVNGTIYDLKLHSTTLTPAQIKANALAIGLYDGPIETEYTGITADLKPASYDPADTTLDTTSTIATNPDANDWQPYGA